MTDNDEYIALEQTNALMRETMLLYNNLDTEDPHTLAPMLFHPGRKVILPVIVDPDPDAPHRFASLVQIGGAVDVVVYSSIRYVPEGPDTEDLVLYPLAELVEELRAKGAYQLLRIDPGTPHAVGIFVDGKAPDLVRLKRVDALLAARRKK